MTDNSSDHSSSEHDPSGQDPAEANPLDRKMISMPVGVVLRRQPGVTRWQKWTWKAVAVLPGAGPADWKVLREDAEAGVTEYHAGTTEMELYRSDVEAYRVALTMTPPSVFVVLRKTLGGDAPHNVEVHRVTASAYEAQDYLDGDDEIVEPVPMPPGLVAWVRDYTDFHFRDEPFIKRKRDKKRIDGQDDGIGDARIRQTADVYRAPGARKARLQ